MTKQTVSPLKGFKRKFLAESTGINQYTLGRILRKQRNVKKTELIALSSVTGLSIDELALELQFEKQAS